MVGWMDGVQYIDVVRYVRLWMDGGREVALCKSSSEREWSIPAHSICSPLPNSLLPQTCVNGAISSVVCGISGSGSGNNVMIISNTVGSALCSAVQ